MNRNSGSVSACDDIQAFCRHIRADECLSTARDIYVACRGTPPESSLGDNELLALFIGIHLLLAKVAFSLAVYAARYIMSLPDEDARQVVIVLINGTHMVCMRQHSVDAIYDMTTYAKADSLPEIVFYTTTYFASGAFFAVDGFRRSCQNSKSSSPPTANASAYYGGST